MAKGTRTASPAKESRGLIPKAELRKIKQRVAKLRKQGHDIWTDDEVASEGWVSEQARKPAGGGLLVAKEKQKESWDCGLACAQMVIGVLGDAKPSNRLLQSRVAAPSVWTIDLAYLLSDFKVECQFLTATPELDAEAYKASAFYASELDADARRVELLLRAAPSEGVEIQKRTLSAAELWNLMRDEDTLVIALVDARLLHMRGQSNGDPNADSREFMGHYVLIVGLDDERNGYLINDPAREDERTFVPSEQLEAARHAAGTDEDLITISAYQSGVEVPQETSTPKIVAVLEKYGNAAAAEGKAAGNPSGDDEGSVQLR